MFSKQEIERANWGASASNKITMLPVFDHKERPDDDCGMPEHPIFSNYTKYLWTSHRRSGGIQIQQVSERKRRKDT